MSPASYPTRGGLDGAAAILRSWGLRVEVGQHALDQYGYLAGRDEDRLSDLNDAFRDPGVRAVITTRGGAGAYRLSDGIDFEAVRANPKPLVGFSDITYLHVALWQQCRLVSIHGCLAGERAVASLRQLLMTTDAITVHRTPEVSSAALEVPGRATGFLTGGHLNGVTGFVGAGMPSFDGAILCFEDNGNTSVPEVLDSALHQLVASGSLAGLRGIAIGHLTDLDTADVPAGQQSTMDILRYWFGVLGVPVLGGLPFGHLPDQSCLPLGATATIDTAAGTLTVAPAVV